LEAEDIIKKHVKKNKIPGISVGLISETDNRVFNYGEIKKEYRQVHLLATIDTQFNNDLIVITEEPLADSDPAPHTPVAGAVLGNPYGQ